MAFQKDVPPEKCDNWLWDSGGDCDSDHCCTTFEGSDVRRNWGNLDQDDDEVEVGILTSQFGWLLYEGL